MTENKWIELNRFNLNKPLFRPRSVFVKKRYIQIRIDYINSKVFYRIVKADSETKAQKND